MWTSLHTIRQVAAITALSIRSIRGRSVTASVAIIGFAGVAVALIMLLGLRQSMKEVYELAGREDVVVILSSGAQWEMMSSLPRSVVDEVKEIVPAGGVSVISPEAVSNHIQLPTADPTLAGVHVAGRGVTPAATHVRAHFQITSGRLFKPGTNEVIVGRGLVKRYPQVRIGSKVRIGRAMLAVVGMFETAGTSAEYEVWLDKSTFLYLTRTTAEGLADASSSIWLKLTDPRIKGRLEAALNSAGSTYQDTKKISLLSERSLWRMYSANLVGRANRVSMAIALVVGLGAIFGAVNTGYASLSVRSREIATLRALGFQRFAIAGSIVAEMVIYGLLGGILGSLLARVLVNQGTIFTFNPDSNSFVAFGFVISASVLVATFAYISCLAIASSIPPIVRALRSGIAVGLHE